MAASTSVLIDLQATAGDLARRLSCLEDFLQAADELLACEKFTSREISRHCRKIVTLMEIAQRSLSESGLKLYKFASCGSDFLKYKVAYFKLLRMLQKMRSCIHDRSLHGRIKRLLLPLSTNLRTPASEELSEFSQAPSAILSSSFARPLPQHTSSTLPQRAPASSDIPEQHVTPIDCSTMPPPDILLCGPNSYRGRPATSHILSPNSQVVHMSPLPTEGEDDCASDGDTDSDSDDDTPARVLYRPRSKFGIYFTSKSSSTLRRSDHSPPPRGSH